MNTEKQINFVKPLSSLCCHALTPSPTADAGERERHSVKFRTFIFQQKLLQENTKDNKNIFIDTHICFLTRFISFDALFFHESQWMKSGTDMTCVLLLGGDKLSVPHWLETYPFVWSVREGGGGRWESRNGNKVVWMMKFDLNKKKRWQERWFRRDRKDPWGEVKMSQRGWKKGGEQSESQRNRQRLLSISRAQRSGEWNWWVHLRLIIAMMDQIADFPQRRLNDSLTQIWMTGFTGGVH